MNQEAGMSTTHPTRAAGGTDRWLAIGTVIWVIGTLGFRLFGQVFFIPGRPLPALVFTLVWTVLTFLGVRWGNASQRLEKHLGATFTVCLVAPGLLLDAFTVSFFSSVFLNMDERVAFIFGAHLLWLYGVAIATALLRPSATTTASA